MNRKFLLLLTVICLALLVGCAADKMAANSTISKFWNGWRDLEKDTILDTLADQVEHNYYVIPTTAGAGAIADMFTNKSFYWEGCTDRNFAITKTTEYRETKLIIVETQVSWLEDSNPVEEEIKFTLKKIDSKWRITKITYIY
ncbi:MAG TPA: hypothetical protein DDZ65_07260 [Firmicutes bacterium]|mgnify:FL=1|nr:hypothetical protein [Bacillota bacterium]